MKKKQRCLFKRFAALVAVLVMCAALCMPCFASNNASTKKWVIVSETQRTGENGSLTKYFKLSPYYNGAEYAFTFSTIYSSVKHEELGVELYDLWATPYNYPDVWRTPVPLGERSYCEIKSVQILESTMNGHDFNGPIMLVPYNRQYAYDITFSRYSSASSFSVALPSFPVNVWQLDGTGNAYGSTSGRFAVKPGEIGTGPLSTLTQVVYYPAVSDFRYAQLSTLNNLSSADLIWACVPNVTTNINRYGVIRISAVVSYFVDANKLPAGLQVGDEFPADTDAFDQLRDNLIEQFPEASDNIENGKSTLTGWNDTETVDTDVATTSISALNAMFQNLGQFLFIVSLMVFGAVVLRMCIKKAVDG